MKNKMDVRSFIYIETVSIKAYLVKRRITTHLFLELDLRVIKCNSDFSELLLLRSLIHPGGGMMVAAWMTD